MVLNNGSVSNGGNRYHRGRATDYDQTSNGNFMDSQAPGLRPPRSKLFPTPNSSMGVARKNSDHVILNTRH
jgi:hypothetical protein